MASKKKHGFTLVELLVVIGIIALLISVLLPALNGARQSAKNIMCSSNLRELGQIVNIYVANNRGKLPYGGMSLVAQPSYTRWLNSPMAALMASHLIDRGTPITYYRGMTTSPQAASPAVYAPRSLLCPEAQLWGRYQTAGADTISRTYAVGRFRNSTQQYAIQIHAGADEGAAVYSDIGQPSESNRVFSDYTFNYIPARPEATAGANSPPHVITVPIKGTTYLPFYSVFANYVDTDPTNVQNVTNPQASIARVTKASDTWMAFDGTGAVNPTNNHWGPNITGASFRHKNMSCNFVYFDGHVENLRVGDIDGGACGTTPTPISAPGVTYVGCIEDERELPIR